MFCKKRCCARSNTAGCFFIAVGLGLFLAFVIPRYVLIMLLGVGCIGAGICMLLKK